MRNPRAMAIAQTESRPDQKEQWTRVLSRRKWIYFNRQNEKESIDKAYCFAKKEKQRQSET